MPGVVGKGSIGVRTAALDGGDYYYFMLGFELIKDTPIADSAS